MSGGKTMNVNYVSNLWYMAAWENEISGDAFLARTFLDQPRLIFRKTDGSYANLADRCPHRFVPLSRGKRDGDRVICGYHGLTFGADGHCVASPFVNSPTPSAQVNSWPTVARNGALWFWPGDPEKADADLIPDLSYLDDGKQVCDRTWMAANYELITDNLMDLGHAEFLHTETFGTNGALFNGHHSTVQEDNGGIWSKWWMPNFPKPAWARKMSDDAQVDHWLDMRWQAPATMVLHIGMAKCGTERGEKLFPEMVSPHIITPETATTSHYFYTRGEGEEGKRMAEKVFNEEDQPMIEAAQRGLGDDDFWDARPVIMKSDAAAIRARRLLAQMRRSEDKQEAQTASLMVTETAG